MGTNNPQRQPINWFWIFFGATAEKSPLQAVKRMFSNLVSVTLSGTEWETLKLKCKAHMGHVLVHARNPVPARI